MKVWKRIVAIMLLLLICGNAMAIEKTNGFIDFDTQLTDGMNKSLTEWFSTSFDRATLTTCLAIDLQLQLGDDFEFGAMLSSPTYVGKTNYLLVIGRNDDTMISIAYAPIHNIRKYNMSTFEDLNKADMLYVLSETCDDYYENNSSDIETCLAVIAKAVNK